MKHITMLPFLSKEDLRELAYKVISNEVKSIRLLLLFPFLDTETINEIVDKLINQKQGKDIVSALPFLSKETIEKIYVAIKNGEIKGIKEETLLPFLDKDQVKKMFDDFLEKAEKEIHESKVDSEELD